MNNANEFKICAIMAFKGVRFHPRKAIEAKYFATYTCYSPQKPRQPPVLGFRHTKSVDNGKMKRHLRVVRFPGSAHECAESTEQKGTVKANQRKMADRKTIKSHDAGIVDGTHQVVLRAVRATLQQGVVDIDGERCKGCELCVFECPAHTLKLSDEVNLRGFRHSEQLRPDRCIGCGSCALICPDGCITVYRKTIIPNALREELQKR